MRDTVIFVEHESRYRAFVDDLGQGITRIGQLGSATRDALFEIVPVAFELLLIVKLLGDVERQRHQPDQGSLLPQRQAPPAATNILTCLSTAVGDRLDHPVLCHRKTRHVGIDFPAVLGDQLLRHALPLNLGIAPAEKAFRLVVPFDHMPTRAPHDQCHRGGLVEHAIADFEALRGGFDFLQRADVGVHAGDPAHLAIGIPVSCGTDTSPAIAARSILNPEVVFDGFEVTAFAAFAEQAGEHVAYASGVVGVDAL